MLMLSSIFLLLSNAMNSQREASILYSRIAIFTLVYPMWFLYNQTIYSFLNLGVTLFNKLFPINLYTMTFWYFLFIFCFCFCIWVEYKNNARDYNRCIIERFFGSSDDLFKPKVQKEVLTIKSSRSARKNFFTHIKIIALFSVLTCPIVVIYHTLNLPLGTAALFLKPIDLTWKSICMYYVLKCFEKEKSFTTIGISYLFSSVFVTSMIYLNISLIDLFSPVYYYIDFYLPIVIAMIYNFFFEIFTLQSILDILIGSIIALQRFTVEVIKFIGIRIRGYKSVKTIFKVFPFLGQGYSDSSEQTTSHPLASSSRQLPPVTRPGQFNVQSSQQVRPYLKWGRGTQEPMLTEKVAKEFVSAGPYPSSNFTWSVETQYDYWTIQHAPTTNYPTNFNEALISYPLGSNETPTITFSGNPNDIIETLPGKTFATTDIAPEVSSKLLGEGTFRVMGLTNENYPKEFYYDRCVLSNNRYNVTKDSFLFDVINGTIIFNEDSFKSNADINLSYILEEHMLTHTIRNRPVNRVSTLKFDNESTKILVYETLRPFLQISDTHPVALDDIKKRGITDTMIMYLRSHILDQRS